MKKLIWTLWVISSLILASEATVVPLSQKFLNEGRDVEFMRGGYLIVLAQSYLENFLVSPAGGNFELFKKTQGFDVEIVSLDGLGIANNDADALKQFIEQYYMDHPLLEYVLFVGDANGNYPIPCYYIPSINEDDLDVTDYPYSYFNDTPGDDEYDVLKPNFLIGRWPVQGTNDLLMAKMKIHPIYNDGEFDSRWVFTVLPGFCFCWWQVTIPIMTAKKSIPPIGR